MNRKQIIITLIVIAVALAGVSLYTTFAYDEEENKLVDSTADYNLIYSIKDSSSQMVSVNAGDTKYLDITIKNIYENTVKYGIYYRLINPSTMPKDVTISLAEDSVDPLQSTIDPKETRKVSIKIVNNSNYNVDLVVGTLVGFEKGNLEELITNNEVLVK